MNGAVKRATKRRLPTLAERPKFSRKSLPWLLVPALAIAAAATWFTLDPGFRNSGSAQMTAASADPDDFGRRVRAYPPENPQVIVQALPVLKTPQPAAPSPEGIAAPARHTAQDIPTPYTPAKP